VTTPSAGPYFGATDDEGDDEYPVESALQEDVSENDRKIATWVAVVPVQSSDTEAVQQVLNALSDRARQVGGHFFRVLLTDRLIVFATHDLSKPARTGRRGRPASPPHDGVFVRPAVAFDYLSRALECGDVVKVSASKSWHVLPAALFDHAPATIVVHEAATLVDHGGPLVDRVTVSPS
jgi:hypothetical protein